ncbi:hypothetical protein BGW36DRAFT_288956 [Talaromyces proteolyticus]|uniref:NACHT domain-containing protein n=1 Tax=Talaromyces proteolyticus TaxID=1131652 RepID=A0AAD4PZV1_9EURO|nr:uncharacterized protein BGW36DRAFT_288956 [Talaromyces proteolyticus]KAH8703398.1 hypothetical protein BGW36DRAFT_288956 [Talaromyces proteolyticus]
MALSVSNLSKLTPEVQLAQAISEYEAVLSTSEKASLRNFKAEQQNHSPDATDVIRLTAKIDQTSQIGRRCVGTRFSNVLNAIQAFAGVGDLVVGGAQNLMASGLWALVRLTLQMATNYLSFLDKFSELFMNIGRSAPRYQNLSLLYPQSSDLQRSVCEYFTTLVQLCTKAVKFTRKSGLNRLVATTLSSFDTEFGGFLVKLERLGNEIKEDVMLLSAKAQQDEVRENSKFRSLVRHKIDKNQADRNQLDRNDQLRRELAAKLSLLDQCSTYDHETAWRQIRKKGNSSWIRQAPEYVQWRDKTGRVLTCFGKLGSGKSVVAANVTEDLLMREPKGTVAYFFCRHDVAQSLKARTILGALARQLLESIDADSELYSTSQWTQSQTRSFQFYELVGLLRYIMLERRLERRHYSITLVIDGLDDCTQADKQILLRDLDLRFVRLFLTTRSELEQTAVLINDFFPLQPTLRMSYQADEINDYINDELNQRLESGALCLGNPEIIVEIQDTLKANAQGMFLWVVLQIDSICDEESDDAILTALRELPPDLPAVYDRILQKKLQSKYRDKTLQLVASAYRPLTLGELREALSVTPGDNVMDTTKFINDIQKTVSCCGGLLELEEEALTVHFVHPSAIQHLFCVEKNRESNSTSARFSKTEADILMGSICVTYLNWNVFETRLAAQQKQWQINASNTASAVVNSSVQSSSLAKKVAQMYLEKTRRSSPSLPGTSSFDFKRALMDVKSGMSEKQPQEFFFLLYAKEYWLDHSKEFTILMGDVWDMWNRLINDSPAVVGRLPWDYPTTLQDNKIQLTWNWAWDELHHALIYTKALEPVNRKLLFEKIEKCETEALAYQLKGGWANSANVRQAILIRVERLYPLLPREVMTAMWNLAISYHVCLVNDKAEELLTDILLKNNGSQPLPIAMPTSSAFRCLLNSTLADHREISLEFLNKVFLLSRKLWGDTVPMEAVLEYREDQKFKNQDLVNRHID